MRLLPKDVVVDGVLHGRLVAAHLRRELADHVAHFRRQGEGFHIALIRVGDDPASAVYVRGKERACEEVGIDSTIFHLSRETSEEEILEVIGRLNADPCIDGILVQLPVPPHMDADRIIDAVDPARDVDGFHPGNLGLLLGRRPLLQPCTPTGVMVLLDAAGVDVRGKEAVVVGRSVIVGRPVSQLLCRSDATVTMCHRHTKDLESHVGRAEILVVATGVSGLVRGDWVRPGAVVIDVGINRRADGKLCGDVEFDVARERAAAITPVPGGVGPMTVAMLLWNTVVAGVARRQLGGGPPPRPVFTGPTVTNRVSP